MKVYVDSIKYVVYSVGVGSLYDDPRHHQTPDTLGYHDFTLFIGSPNAKLFAQRV